MELAWAEEVMLGAAMWWVVGPRDWDTKPPELKKPLLGDGMRQAWSITEPVDIGSIAQPIDIGIIVWIMEQPWRMAKI